MDILYDSVVSICLECGSKNIINDSESGEVICGSCGLVISEPSISTDPEWRAFSRAEFEEKARIGPPNYLSIYDKGLSTTIYPIGRDVFGRSISKETRFQMIRLSKWNVRSRIQASFNRNLVQAMAELDRLTERLHIPRAVKEEAAFIYRKALRKGIVRGRSIPSMVAASIYVACRMTQTPRTLEEVDRHSPIDKKDIARCYRTLLKELNLRMPVPKAQYRVPKIASGVELSENTQRKAIDILGEADRLKITGGKAPMGMAAAALYLACMMNGENCTQKMLAEASGVTEVTIRNRYKELKRFLNLDMFKPERG